jgi:hypothetical protein
MYWGRVFYDLSFFILVNFVSLNIIFGIIIDTFSQLRNKETERGKFSNTNKNTRIR